MIRTVDVKLPDIMFEFNVTSQRMLSMKGEEELEILFGSSIRGNRKLDESVSTKLLTGSDVKITKKENFLWVFLIKLS